MVDDPEKTETTEDLRGASSITSDLASICDRFEKQWRSGDAAPVIEEYLKDAADVERSRLLCELLVIDATYRRRTGRTCSREDYVIRFPAESQIVANAFDRLLVDETALKIDSSDDSIEGPISVASQLGSLRFHASGGLGKVFVASDDSLNREVAVKFIHRELAEGPDHRERFYLEAEITGRLEHPGVVPVYGVGSTEDGQAFYAMRYIDGQTLDDAIRDFYATADRSRDERRKQFRQLLTHFVAVCQTIAYAHNRGIVHRDLKPDNVMLGRFGETLVVDWGLAVSVGRQGVFKESGEKTLLPSSGSQQSGSTGGVAGTPAYMSPEQAAGAQQLTPASDIYGLGATLYKILCNKPPIRGAMDKIRSKIIRGQFPRPSEIIKHCSRSLEAICLKAMAVEPEQRYSTALELGKDVENYLSDMPVRAYKEPWDRWVARWSRRNRTVAQLLLVGLILLTVLGGLGVMRFSKQALTEKRLKNEYLRQQQNEFELRRRNLSLSANFAARTIGNKLDICLAILEKEAADPNLCNLLSNLNETMGQAALTEVDHSFLDDNCTDLQRWIDQSRDRYPLLQSRSWFLCARNGTQVARAPSRYTVGDKPGERFKSLGRNYSYRAYFRGGSDDGAAVASEARSQSPQILANANISGAIESTNDGDFAVVFSVPITTQTSSTEGPLSPRQQPIGVLGMSIRLGDFADLQIKLAEGHVLLVDTRGYNMIRRSGRPQSGVGLVLHDDRYRGLEDLKTRDFLPYLDSSSLNEMVSSADKSNNLFSNDYRDPVTSDTGLLAAFAPVYLYSRASEERENTGWFVVVHQARNRVTQPDRNQQKPD